MTSKPALRMLSTVVEPTTRVASCNLSAAGNASCSEQPLLAKELAGGKSQAASARPLEVLTADSPPYPHRCDAGPQNWPPTPIPLHRSPSLCDVSIVHPVCSILFWFFSLSLWRLTLGLSRAQEPQRRRSEGCKRSPASACSARSPRHMRLPPVCPARLLDHLGCLEQGAVPVSTRDI
jgi:hypothetical protein